MRQGVLDCKSSVGMWHVFKHMILLGNDFMGACFQVPCAKPGQWLMETFCFLLLLFYIFFLYFFLHLVGRDAAYFLFIFLYCVSSVGWWISHMGFTINFMSFGCKHFFCDFMFTSLHKANGKSLVIFKTVMPK